MDHLRLNTQELSEGFSVSIRDKAKAERRKKMAASILAKTDINQQEIKNLKQNVLTQGEIQKFLKELKFISTKTQVMTEFLPITQKLIEISLTTQDINTFSDAMTILINLTICEGFKISDENTAKIMKLAFVPTKMEIVQSFISNLLQDPNEKIIKILLNAGLMDYLSQRFKLIFSSSEEQLNFLSFMCGILINAKWIESKLLEQILEVISSMNITERKEGDWIISAALSECGEDALSTKTILESKLYNYIIVTLEGKSSKEVINILKFILNISKDISQYKLLQSKNIFEVLQKTWANRHPSIKPLIVQITANFVKVPDMLVSKLFSGIMSLVPYFESHSPALKFQLGKLVLTLLKMSNGQQLVVPLVQSGILQHIKSLLKNQNVYMVLLGIQILGNILGLRPNLSAQCQALNIHIEVENLQKHPSNVVYQWAKALIDQYFKA